jgi:hypothetical protein
MLVGEKVRQSHHRLTQVIFSPKVLDWFEDKDTVVFCTFLEHFDDVKAAQACTLACPGDVRALTQKSVQSRKRSSDSLSKIAIAQNILTTRFPNTA